MITSPNYFRITTNCHGPYCLMMWTFAGLKNDSITVFNKGYVMRIGVYKIESKIELNCKLSQFFLKKFD